MNNIRTIVGAMSAATSLLVYGGAVPEVSDVEMTQAGTGREVTVTYSLSAPAVVTLDVQTNANLEAEADDPGWTSIGGVAVCNAKGDVWKKVETGSGVIRWRPDESWPGHKIADGGARAVVTAWALDCTPDYMVVDISSAAQAGTQRYYPAADFLPGALAGQTGAVTNNPIYRTTTILMRKIMARNVTWTMGSTPAEPSRDPGKEATHLVTLTNNYYIGVFPVTQAQWALIQPDRQFPSYFSSVSDRAMRPVERVCFNELRMSANLTSVASGAEEWPGAPYEGSFLDLLRDKTGIDFDLPSEAQWEFAARAGNGDTKRGDGSAVLEGTVDANLSGFGRYEANGGYIDGAAPGEGASAENGTAVVGSYRPNDWGIYDTCGNVWEQCLDWYTDDISSLDGAVNTVSTSGKRVMRGGAWNNNAGWCRPAARSSVDPSAARGNYSIGFRLACRAGLD